jgi:flagellar protein FlbD
LIALSKLDSKNVLISLDTIKYIESTPDTLVFFINGDSLIVRESLEEVQRRVVEYKARVLKNSEVSKS